MAIGFSFPEAKGKGQWLIIRDTPKEVCENKFLDVKLKADLLFKVGMRIEQMPEVHPKQT